MLMLDDISEALDYVPGGISLTTGLSHIFMGSISLSPFPIGGFRSFRD